MSEHEEGSSTKKPYAAPAVKQLCGKRPWAKDMVDMRCMLPEHPPTEAHRSEDYCWTDESQLCCAIGPEGAVCHLDKNHRTPHLSDERDITWVREGLTEEERDRYRSEILRLREQAAAMQEANKKLAESWRLSEDEWEREKLRLQKEVDEARARGDQWERDVVAPLRRWARCHILGSWSDATAIQYLLEAAAAEKVIQEIIDAIDVLEDVDGFTIGIVRGRIIDIGNCLRGDVGRDIRQILSEPPAVQPIADHPYEPPQVMKQRDVLAEVGRVAQLISERDGLAASLRERHAQCVKAEKQIGVLEDRLKWSDMKRHQAEELGDRRVAERELVYSEVQRLQRLVVSLETGVKDARRQERSRCSLWVKARVAASNFAPERDILSDVAEKLLKLGDAP